ncbi:tail fiber assembly protein [Citrobacter braakii]|uniref:tail fiber assembly protein n=1 Tax=Citrobacter braakii TaxID=57706 RepID=UPI0024314B6E|nr:tail fiber assembly protein [Citrobacter braakii]WFZ46738.1 tail fiber assembly protein [Citrobacter braakii]
MKVFYSAKDNGFYPDDIKFNNLPDDLIEISVDYWQELLNGQNGKKEISSDKNGYPVLVDVAPATAEQLKVIASREKERLMALATVAIAPLQDAVELGIATAEETAALSEWKKYRVLLMRVDTAKPEWPTPPGGQAS